MSDRESTNPATGPFEACVNCATSLAADATQCPRCGVRRIPLGASGPPVASPMTPPGSFQPGFPMPGGYAPPGYPTPGAYAQPGYPPSGYGGVPYASAGYPRRSNSKATTALVLGIVGLVVCQIASIFAIIIGNQAAREIRYSGGTQSGEGMATAGRILGWIGVAFFVLVVILILTIRLLGTTTTPN